MRTSLGIGPGRLARVERRHRSSADRPRPFERPVSCRLRSALCCERVCMCVCVCVCGERDRESERGGAPPAFRVASVMHVLNFIKSSILIFILYRNVQSQVRFRKWKGREDESRPSRVCPTQFTRCPAPFRVYARSARVCTLLLSLSLTHCLSCEVRVGG